MNCSLAMPNQALQRTAPVGHAACSPQSPPGRQRARPALSLSLGSFGDACVMSLKRFAAAGLGLVTRSVSAVSAAEVYSGEPLTEALHDLAGTATLVAHELSSATALRRTDVFCLADGRLIAVTSRANKLGEPYSIEAIRVTPSATSKLTRGLPSVSTVELPK